VFQSAASEVVLRNIELIRLVQKHVLECFFFFSSGMLSEQLISRILIYIIYVRIKTNYDNR